METIINEFYSKKGRAPSTQEIMDELDGQVALEIVESMVADRTEAGGNVVIDIANT